MKESKSKIVIDKTLHEIAEVRRMGAETGDFTFEEVDQYIAETGAEVIEKYNNMTDVEFIQAVLERMLNNNKMREELKNSL